MTTYHGKSVSPGIGIGTIRVLIKGGAVISQAPLGSPDEEWARFLGAKAQANEQLSVLYDKTLKELGEEKAAIIDVQRLMLEDGDFNDAAEALIMDEHVSAADAAARAGRQFSEFFASLDDEYMKARATDVSDVASRLTDILLGISKEEAFTGPTVVIADDITPSETLQMDRSLVAGFVICKGSANSHTAILARTLNIPCLVESDIELKPDIDGMEIIVDGKAGVCYVDPDEPTRAAMIAKKNEEDSDKEQLKSLRGQKTITKSGKAARKSAV